MSEKGKIAKLIWTVTYAHVIAYAVAGMIAYFMLPYDEIWALDVMYFYLPIDTPILALAIALQVPRGVLIALFVLPLRKAFFEEKHGLWKLGLIVLGFAVISTIGAPWGSYESFIYTRFPLWLQLWAIPESLLYIGAFIGILALAKKFAHKKITDVIAAILLVAFCAMSIFGFLSLVAA